ncbi:hypothetical protein BWP24_17660 [Vibrio campbellii]|uniref:hypothetical protein n=1 Tax=Vibrio campbellii TaxID=680 RepID=UPI0009719866|nr:hypothetical protein [Vibrio campbellii]APX08031.1 hypothetical protein BWP24_17660 [Vibrio campbellii]ARR09815.1 hypothetical protein Vc3S01_A1842 [Vibrio campbellii]
MKIKLLTASVAAVLLAGCGSDSDPVVKTYSVQAYDPAVIDMKVEAVCGGETYEAIELTTNYKGMVGQARFENLDVVDSPDQCEFILTHTDSSRDASNGKPITTDYAIPQGLAQVDGLVTGSPFTTLIASSLEDGELYSPEVAEKVFSDLGIDINAIGVSVDELLLNTEQVVQDLQAQEDEGASAIATQLIATANVVSDVIKANPEASPESISVAAKSITEEVITANPDYPKSETGEVIYVTIPAEDTQKVVGDVQDAIDAGTPTDEIKPDVPTIPEPEVGEPIDPVDPPTGTGGTGGN